MSDIERGFAAFRKEAGQRISELQRENAELRGEVEWRTKRMEILSDGLQGVSDVLKKTINKIAEDALQSDESKLIDAARKEAQP
jgi:hypothetical protein